MRIAVVDNVPEGGAKRVVYHQMLGLANSHELYYFSSDIHSFFPFETIAKEVKKYPLTLQQGNGLWRYQKELSVFTQLLPRYGEMARDVVAANVDVVLVHPDAITQAPFVLSLIKDTPTLYFIEEWPRVVYEPLLHPLPDASLSKQMYEYARRQMIRFIDATNAKAATRLVANSEFTAKRAQQVYGQMVTSLPLGVDTAQFVPHFEMKRKHFLFIGEKADINGYPLLVEALKVASLPFVVRYVTFDKEGGFSVTDDMLRDLYQQAVATLCLAVDEPFGLTAIESMACGTPVIAVRQGGYMETVIDQETGILIDRDAKKLAQAMKFLSTRETEREAFGKAGRKRVEALFTWEKHTRVLEQILEDL